MHQALFECRIASNYLHGRVTVPSLRCDNLKTVWWVNWLLWCNSRQIFPVPLIFPASLDLKNRDLAQCPQFCNKLQVIITLTKNLTRSTKNLCCICAFEHFSCRNNWTSAGFGSQTSLPYCSCSQLLTCYLHRTMEALQLLQCDYSNRGHPTKFSTNLTNKNRGG